MPSCEKCWHDAGGDAGKYLQILTERTEAGIGCTPEQQAGEEAGTCPKCNRRTMHQHAHVCTICGHRSNARLDRPEGAAGETHGH